MKNSTFTKKISLIIMMLCFSALYGTQAQTTMEEFMQKWESGRTFTLEVVDKMPDNLLDYRPHESAMSFREQVVHVASSVAGLSKNFMLGSEPEFELDAKPQSKEDLKQFINKCYDYGKETIANLTEDQLAEEIDTFAGKVTRRRMLGLIDDHATHHRGAAVSYIRSNGIEPPAFRGL